MKYENRPDGRKFNEIRPITIKAGIIPNADGSCYFKIGDTVAMAAVYGPRNLYPKFLQDPKKGILRVNYNMMPFSGVGDRIRPGQNRRAKEISLVTEKALSPVLELDEFPNAVVDVFIEIPQADAGTRCAGICAASVALADAGVPMKDMVAAIAVGRMGDSYVVDLNYDEEAMKDMNPADVPVAFIRSTGQVSLLQVDGELSRDDLKNLLELGKTACNEIHAKMEAALKEKYFDPNLGADLDLELDNEVSSNEQ